MEDSVRPGVDQTEPIMNNFERLISLLACGCFAMSVACDSGSDGDSADDGGAGSDGTGSGTGGAADGGAGGAGDPTVAAICPELVDAACPALAAFLPDVTTCGSGLPLLALACSDAVDALGACTGPDPDITCDATTGAPTSEGCEVEWGAVMTCAADLIQQGGGGAGGAGGAGG